MRRLLYGNLKLVYKTSQWMRHRFTSNGILILLIMPIAGVFGFDTRSTLSFQIFSITLLLLITAICYSFFFRGRYLIKRELPDYGTVDTPFFYLCTVTNQNKKDKKGLIIIDQLRTRLPSLSQFKKIKDPLDSKRNKVDQIIGYPRLVNVIRKLRGGSIKPVTLDFISKNSEASTALSLTPLRRGYLYFDSLKLAQSDPLGIYLARKTFKSTDKLLILPRIYKVPRLNLPGKRTYQRGGINNAASVGDSQEFISLRDYRPGDPLKAIHWRSFAKNNKPIVKEYQDEFFIRYGLLLDTWLDDLSPVLFEDAVSIAASFMSSQQERDSIMDLMFIGEKAYRFTSGRNLTDTRNILEILACIEPDPEANLDRLEVMIEQHAQECSAIICILLNIDESRIKLLNKISTYSLPLKILCVTDSLDKNIAHDVNFDIHMIRHNEIQHDLTRLN